MPGRIIHEPPAKHECSGMPLPEKYFPGTIWQCDECDQKWVLVHGAQYNEPYTAWRKLTNQNKYGRDL